jgi:hypothetical protein
VDVVGQIDGPVYQDQPMTFLKMPYGLKFFPKGADGDLWIELTPEGTIQFNGFSSTDEATQAFIKIATDIFPQYVEGLVDRKLKLMGYK